MTERFTLHVRDLVVPNVDREIPAYWINVSVYENAPDMHRSMSRAEGRPLSWYSASGGVVGGGWFGAKMSTRNGYLGILRLTREHLSVENLVHESVHVAVNLTQRLFGCDPLRLPVGGMGTREEVVAYAAGPLAAALIERLI